jgi:hypothetical protein
MSKTQELLRERLGRDSRLQNVKVIENVYLINKETDKTVMLTLRQDTETSKYSVRTVEGARKDNSVDTKLKFAKLAEYTKETSKIDKAKRFYQEIETNYRDKDYVNGKGRPPLPDEKLVTIDKESSSGRTPKIQGMACMDNSDTPFVILKREKDHISIRIFNNYDEKTVSGEKDDDIKDVMMSVIEQFEKDGYGKVTRKRKKEIAEKNESDNDDDDDE